MRAGGQQAAGPVSVGARPGSLVVCDARTVESPMTRSSIHALPTRVLQSGAGASVLFVIVATQPMSVSRKSHW